MSGTTIIYSHFTITVSVSHLYTKYSHLPEVGVDHADSYAFFTYAGTCLQGSIYLVGSNGPNTVEGRVEYCSNGVWGTISSYGFDSRDGEVVCRRLGYQHPRKLACMHTWKTFLQFYCVIGTKISYLVHGHIKILNYAFSLTC